MIIETKLGKIGISREILVGVMFMLFVLAILILGTQMVRAQGACEGPGYISHDSKEYFKTLDEALSKGEEMPPEPLTTQNINTLDKANLDKVRKNYQCTKDVLTEALKNPQTADYITKTVGDGGEMGQTVKDIEAQNNVKILNNILDSYIKSNDPENAQAYINKLGYPQEIDGALLDQLKFFSYGEDKILLEYGDSPVPKGKFGEGTTLTSDENGKPMIEYPGKVQADGATPDPADAAAKGGGGGGGGAGDKEIFDAMQQAANAAQSALAALKDTLKKQPNAPNLFVPADTEGEVKVPEGESVVVGDGNGNTVVVEGGKGGAVVSWGKEGLKTMTARNGNLFGFVNAKQVATVTAPATDTKVTLNPSADNPAQQNLGGTTSGTTNFFLPLISAQEDASITGDVIQATSSDQFIDIIGYDINMAGKDIGVSLHKPFDDIDGKGSNLLIADGDVLIGFSSLKTMYSREVEKNEFFINKIQNKQDTKNVFTLTPGGSDGNYLIDGKKILTVGDAVVKNPLEGYEELMIPKTRLAMWKKAAARNW